MLLKVLVSLYHNLKLLAIKDPIVVQPDCEATFISCGPDLLSYNLAGDGDFELISSHLSEVIELAFAVVDMRYDAVASSILDQFSLVKVNCSVSVSCLGKHLEVDFLGKSFESDLVDIVHKHLDVLLEHNIHSLRRDHSRRVTICLVNQYVVGESFGHFGNPEFELYNT